MRRQFGIGKRLHDGVRALGPAAIKLADDRFLALGADSYSTRSEEHSSSVRLAGHGAGLPDNVGNDFLMAKAILERHHHRIRADYRRGRLDCLAGVVRLDEDDDEVSGTDA